MTFCTQASEDPGRMITQHMLQWEFLIGEIRRAERTRVEFWLWFCYREKGLSENVVVGGAAQAILPNLMVRLHPVFHNT
jgi:hypothetical protein